MADETARPTREEINRRLQDAATITIHGKKYPTVNLRVLAFYELHPKGQIQTEILSDDGNRCVVKATVDTGEGQVCTAHAFEVRKGQINATSYLENCETSAVGRAMAFLGIGVLESIASADEVIGAQQRPPQGQQVPGVLGACKACGQVYQFADPSQLSGACACECGCTDFAQVQR